MNGKYISYEKQHIHVFGYSEIEKVWKFLGCRLDIPGMGICTALHQDLPRRTKFDGIIKLNEYELSNF
jgi:hypothetical protein